MRLLVLAFFVGRTALDRSAVFRGRV